MENDLELKELRVDLEGMLPSFQSDIHKYYLNINNEIDEITVEAISKNIDNDIEIIGNRDLKNGKNEIIIKVKNGNNESVYNIEVIKTDNIEIFNANLETLAIQDALLEPDFDKNITNYKLEVPNETKNLNILAIPEIEDAQIQIKGAYELDVGKNLVEVIVSSVNGEIEKNYNIEVYRRSREENKVYNLNEEINEEKVKEILEKQADIYTTEKLNLETFYYRSDNNILKISVLSMILIVLVVVIIMKKFKQETK